MRALVTGGYGFAGRYLTSTLEALGYEAVSTVGPREQEDGPRIDLTDSDSLEAALAQSEPDVIFHLAGQAFVPDSRVNPLHTYDVNGMGTVRLLEAVRRYGRVLGRPMPRVVFTSSASVYGRTDNGSDGLLEEQPVRPVDPYGASKASAESACIAWWRSFGVETVIARSFNHIGAGQDERFVVASFAAQLANIKHRDVEKTLLVGNIETARDFLDVRDVVRAYITLAEKGEPGEIYNVCSGTPRRIRDVLQSLIVERDKRRILFQ